MTSKWIHFVCDVAVMWPRFWGSQHFLSAFVISFSFCVCIWVGGGQHVLALAGEMPCRLRARTRAAIDSHLKFRAQLIHSFPKAQPLWLLVAGKWNRVLFSPLCCIAAMQLANRHSSWCEMGMFSTFKWNFKKCICRGQDVENQISNIQKSKSIQKHYFW